MANNSTNETRSISMPEELWSIVDELAEDENISRSEVMRDFVKFGRIYFSEDYTLDKILKEYIKDFLLDTPLSQMSKSMDEIEEDIKVFNEKPMEEEDS